MKRARALVVLALVGAACADDTRSAPDPLEAMMSAQPPSREPIVARVGSGAITEGELRAKAARRAEGAGASASPEALVDDLVLEDLAAAEAVRQGLLREPGVRHAARRAMVQQLIEQAFERPMASEAIPEDVLRRGYDANYWYYNKPEIRPYEHLLVFSLSNEKQERRQLAKALAQGILDDLRSRPPRRLADVQSPTRQRVAAAGFEFRFERGRATRTNVEKDFADLVFATPAGDIGARLAESRFGYHVVQTLEVVPARERPFEQVRADVERRIRPDWLRMRFRRWLTELASKHKAEITPEAHLVFREPNVLAK